VQFPQIPIAIVLAFVASLSACFVPIQLPDKELFNDESLAFIEIGKTTKDEIATAMSDLATRTDEGESKTEFRLEEFRGGDWWLYVQERDELAWFVFAGTGMGQLGDTDLRFLLIEFDPNGVVAGYELSSSEGYGCNREGVCVLGSSHSLLASEDEDRVVKQFDALFDRCGIYVYAKSKFAGSYYASSISIWLDGHQVDWLLNQEHFFFWQLDPGVHQLAADISIAEHQTSTEFTCVAGELLYFELGEKRKSFFSSGYWIEIEHQDAVTGREAVTKRRLTLDNTEPLD
jgi:hypothetical protein